MVKNHHISEEKPPYRPYGRYVCDWNLTEAHLFRTVVAAREFARKWGRDCNIGWLAPTYNHKTGRNSHPSCFDAKKQIHSRVVIVDHRGDRT